MGDIIGSPVLPRSNLNGTPPKGSDVSTKVTLAAIEDDTTSLQAGDVHLREAATSRFVSAGLPSVGIATPGNTAKPGFS